MDKGVLTGPCQLSVNLAERLKGSRVRFLLESKIAEIGVKWYEVFANFENCYILNDFSGLIKTSLA